MPVEPMTAVEIEKLAADKQLRTVPSGSQSRALQQAQTLVRENRRRFDSRSKPGSDYVPNSTQVEIEAEPVH
jgi:hypothetical protein